MASRTFAIFAGPGAWHLAASDSAGTEWVEIADAVEASRVELAQRIRASLVERGYRGEEVMLAAASEWCLAAGISIADLPKRNRRQAMLYRLEEKLPIAAEELVADFVCGDAAALGVCVQAQTIAPIVSALEGEGVAIGGICPAALLAIQTAPAGQRGDEWDLLLWGRGDVIELFRQRGGLLAGWETIPATRADLALHVGVHAVQAANPPRIAAMAVEPGLMEGLPQAVTVEEGGSAGGSMMSAAAAASHEVLCGRRAALVDLRRGGLAGGDAIRRVRRPLIAAVCALALLLGSASGMMLWRAERYQRFAEESQRRQLALFEGAFPAQSAPPDIRSRLASEERRLRALGGESRQMPRQGSALVMLREVLGGLPRGVRHRLLEIRLEQDWFQLEGQSLSHGDADAVAAGVRRSGAFRVDDPRTEQLPDGEISFTISGVADDDDLGRRASR